MQVIVGGEQGPDARPMDADWARKLRDECAAKGVSFFLYQMARRKEIPPDLYQAVATVLAFVMRLKRRGSAAGVHRMQPAR